MTELIKNTLLVLTLACAVVLIILMCFATQFPLLVTSRLLSVLLLLALICGSIWIASVWSDD